MNVYESILRPIAFKLNPESVHELAMGMLRRGAVLTSTFQDARLEQTLFGVHFPNPLGLAAGFDKNAVALNQWHRLGFGFVECGTITFHAQPGNPKPRMFRLPEEKGLINRLGFNNDGADAIAGRIAASRSRVPLGINLGKSKVTPLEEAARDYGQSFGLLHALGDYFVVNVSSPNTPGLRALQDKAALTEILATLRDTDPSRPMFVKVAPDLEFDALDEVLEVAVGAKLTGLIATNTTIARDMLREDPNQSGGLSGRPVREKANATLRHLGKNAPKEMILIGVGGIMTGADLYEKIRLGAHLAQVYTGWIYGGPGMVPRTLRELAAMMDRDGVTSLAELRGTAL